MLLTYIFFLVRKKIKTEPREELIEISTPQGETMTLTILNELDSSRPTQEAEEILTLVQNADGEIVNSKMIELEDTTQTVMIQETEDNSINATLKMVEGSSVGMCSISSLNNLLLSIK